MEPLVLMASFNSLPTAIRLFVPIRYSLAVLGIECLLWLRPLVDVYMLRLALNSI